MAEHIMAITTVADEKSAAVLARTLVERRIVACVNIVPGVRSIYRFKGAIEDEAECVLLMKTRGARFGELAAALSELHAYEVPELIAVPIEKGSAAYLGWVDENT